MATVSEVSICNLALSRIGGATIQSLTEQSAEALACNIFYDRTRRTVLRSHPWSFATVVVPLAQLSEAEDGWDYAYEKPSDCLRIIGIPDDNGDLDKVDFELRGESILTDWEYASLRYIKDITDTTRFDEQFIEAMSYRLAADLAMPLSQNASFVTGMMNLFGAAISQAKASDAKEGRKVKRLGSIFIDARA